MNILDSEKRNSPLVLARKAIRDPRKAVSVLTHRLFAMAGHRNYRRFIVLTRDRTGSNMLIQSLNSHPAIAADYEIFAKLRGRSEHAILAASFGKQPFYIKAKGFKIFYYHPQDAAGSPVWDMLSAIDDLHVIHLRRRNLLHAVVSSRIAYATGIYGVRSGKEEAQYRQDLPELRIDPEALLRDFEETRRWEREGAERFAGKPMLDLDYEGITADLPAEFRKVTDFLGLAPALPRSDFRKQRTRPMREGVANYDELKAVFAGSEWAWMFDE